MVAVLGPNISARIMQERRYFKVSELRKVVWPTRVETGQTTAIVVVVVLIVALILWALDSLFAWIIASLIG